MQVILYERANDNVIMVLQGIPEMGDDYIVDDSGNGLRGCDLTNVVDYLCVEDAVDTSAITLKTDVSDADHVDLSIEVKVKKKKKELKEADKRAEAITALLGTGDIPYDPDA